MARLLVYTPTIGDTMRPETRESIEAQITNHSFDWEIGHHNPFPGEKMRNVVAQYQRARQMTLDGGYEALITVEHDMVLPPDAIEKLYATDAPVVYGVYMLRHGTHVLNTWQYTNGKNLGMSLSLYPKELKKYRERGWGEVCGVGWGCTLIRREILERIEIYTNTTTDAGDLMFAANCVRAGIRQIARFDVPCGHIHEGVILEPFENGGIVARIYALDNVTANVMGTSTPMRKGSYYTIPLSDALELARAGYVKITNDSDNGEMETTEAPVTRETAVAPVSKRKPKPKAK